MKANELLSTYRKGRNVVAMTETEMKGKKNKKQEINSMYMNFRVFFKQITVYLYIEKYIYMKYSLS